MSGLRAQSLNLCNLWMNLLSCLPWLRVRSSSMLRPLILIVLALAAGPAAAQPFKGTKQPDVRYVPSPDSVVDAMLELAHVTAGDIVFDLGSGDGRIPISAAAKYGAFGVGVEIDAKLNREAADNARKAGVTDRVRFLT